MLLRNIVPFFARSRLRGLVRLGPACLLLATSAVQAEAPILGSIDDQQLREGESFRLVVSAIDPDGDRVTFSASGLPGFCSLANSGGGAAVINCSTGAGDAGTYTVTVTARDDSVLLEESSETFNIVVIANSAPSLSNISNQSVAEGASINIELRATDADGDALTFSFRSAPSTAESFCSLTDRGNGNATLACSPGAGNGGNYNVTVSVRDNAPIRNRQG
jgi:hypothetical protein